MEQILGEIGEDLESYLDLEGLVVEAFTKNRQLVNDLFWVWIGRIFDSLLAPACSSADSLAASRQ